MIALDILNRVSNSVGTNKRISFKHYKKMSKNTKLIITRMHHLSLNHITDYILAT